MEEPQLQVLLVQVQVQAQVQVQVRRRDSGLARAWGCKPGWLEGRISIVMSARDEMDIGADVPDGAA